MTLDSDDVAHCRRLLDAGSKSFAAASTLLPPATRDPAAALYAFCRVADDAVDEGGGAAALPDLYARLDAAYAGAPQPNPVDRAFAATVLAAGIPRGVPALLLEGFAWDVDGRVYHTLDDLHGYCVRVASTVGVMMTLLMGVRDRDVLARAADLGLAMQLTNIARDVGEDARNGRFYIPRAWARDAALDVDAFLAAPRFDARVGLLTRRLLDNADWLYARADAGITHLPRRARVAIRAASLIYADIGREVRAAGYDSVGRRAHTSKARKLVLLTAAVDAVRWPARPVDQPPLPAVVPLLDAVTA